MKKLVFVAIVGFVAVALGLPTFIFVTFLHSSSGSNATTTLYDIQPGKTLQSVASDLQNLGYLRNAKLFLLYARLMGSSSRMKTGEYQIEGDVTPSELLETLTSGKSFERSLTVSEGLNVYEIADLMDRAGIEKRESFLKLVRDPVFIQQTLGERQYSLEGYLYPETYKYSKYTDAKSIVQQMVKRFKTAYDGLIEDYPSTRFNRHQLVTFASIVEKETGAAKERPLVASVFFNRLNKGMLLQTDPTVIYGMADLLGSVPTKISRADLTKPTKYNTYVIKGLPPGPIANPGRDAMLAVLQPATTEYLFFVSHNDGTHAFSKDYQSHRRAVEKFQLDPKARQGKSWRDLKKVAN